MAKNNLKNILISNGILQTELASKANIAAGTINKVCNQRLKVAPVTEA